MSSTLESHHANLIIGGGLGGLTCAVRLAAAGKPVTLVEATDRLGGRVRSDHVDGFTLDHGFQVLLTAYPACRELLDYDALKLRRFEPGALIRHRGRFRLLGDPWRRPSQLVATALHPVSGLADKLRVARLRNQSRRGSLESLYRRPQTATIERLKDDGFSDPMIDRFFRPFLGGVFLDESLGCPSRMLEFVFRMFAEGDIAVPADGMEAIPRQLAERLPRGSITLRNSVRAVTLDAPVSGARPSGPNYRVTLSDGNEITADRVVVAVEADAAARLLGRPDVATSWSGTTNLYYAADNPPDSRKLLMLRGDETGIVQTAVVLSNVAPEYAPGGQSLVSVSVDAGDHDPETGDTESLDLEVREQLGSWFGDAVRRWRLLQVYRIPYGLPRLDLEPVLAQVTESRLGDRSVPENTLFVCGDHRETPSIQGAMNSGLRVADAIVGE